MSSNLREVNAPQSPRNLAIKPVTLTDGQLAEMTAMLWFVLIRLWLRARAAFDAVNGATRSEAMGRRRYLDGQARAQRKLAAKKARKRQKAVNLYAKTPAKGERGYGMDLRQLITVTVFVFMRFALLSVTILVIAIYTRASGISADLSQYWWMALAFAFPALMLSWALSCVSDAFDSKAGKRRVALTYVALGLPTALVWISLMAAMIGPTGASVQGGGTSMSLTLDPVATAPVQEVPALIATLRLWLAAMFGDIGLGAALIFTHVVADVLIGAATTIWSKLSFLAGRETVFQRSIEYGALDAEYAETMRTLRDIENELAIVSAVEQDFRKGRRATVRDALARFPAIRLAVKADRLTQHSDRIEAFKRAS